MFACRFLICQKLRDVDNYEAKLLPAARFWLAMMTRWFRLYTLTTTTSSSGVPKAIRRAPFHPDCVSPTRASLYGRDIQQLTTRAPTDESTDNEFRSVFTIAVDAHGRAHGRCNRWGVPGRRLATWPCCGQARECKNFHGTPPHCEFCSRGKGGTELLKSW